LSSGTGADVLMIISGIGILLPSSSETVCAPACARGRSLKGLSSSFQGANPFRQRGPSAPHAAFLRTTSTLRLSSPEFNRAKDSRFR
jgi:hypothetical protein